MSNIIQVIGFIALIFSLWGNWLINKQHKEGFIIWIISNIVWIVVDVYLFNIFQIIMYLVYIVLNIQGYKMWSKVRKNNDEMK